MNRGRLVASRGQAALRLALVLLLGLLALTGCRRARSRSVAATRAGYALPPPPPPPAVDGELLPPPPPPPTRVAYREPVPPPPREPRPVSPAERTPRVTTMYGPAAPPHAWAERLLLERDMLRVIAHTMDSLVVLPRPLIVEARECPQLAFWSARQGAIVVCYRYLALVRDVVGKADLAPVLVFTLLHEVAHALMTELRLPVVGRDEDAADRFAAVVLLSDPNLALFLRPNIAFFDQLARRAEQPLWDEHSTDGQRSNDLTCLTWGAAPNASADLEGRIAPERRERCPMEFDRASRSWNQLLAPHRPPSPAR